MQTPREKKIWAHASAHMADCDSFALISGACPFYSPMRYILIPSSIFGSVRPFMIMTKMKNMGIGTVNQTMYEEDFTPLNTHQ